MSKIVKKGQIMVLTSGDYSDYGINAIFKALEDFDLDAEVQEYYKQETEVQFDRNRRKTGIDFPAWLVKWRVAEEVDFLEIHTGDYGEVDIEY